MSIYKNTVFGNLFDQIFCIHLGISIVVSLISNLVFDHRIFAIPLSLNNDFGKIVMDVMVLSLLITIAFLIQTLIELFSQN
jgi:hypothetical protein